MEWLREVLEKASITDGKLDIEGLIKQVSTEFPKHAVPKNVFNEKNDALKTAEKTIADLKKENGDNADLQKKVSDYETEIGNLKKAAADTAKTYALKELLSKQGVLDPDYLIYKQGGLEKFNFDKEGKPIGIDEVLKPYKEDETLAHLFKQEQGKPGYKPHGGGGGGAINPFAKETFNMTEQGKLLKSNPEQARALAAAAGVKI